MNFCTNIPRIWERGEEEEKKNESVHWPGIEPGPPAWQARILPLNHQCFAGRNCYY